MKKVRFTIPGEPQGKGRPRFATRITKSGRAFATAYTPEDTKAYEKRVAAAYYAKHRGFAFDKGTALAMLITAYCAIPSSASHKKREEMLDGFIRPAKKPDADNIIKVICDALNGKAYYDDTQVVDVHLVKHFDNSPRVEVVIIPAYLLNEKVKNAKKVEEEQCRLPI